MTRPEASRKVIGTIALAKGWSMLALAYGIYQ
jgi:hypothetical protein